MARGRTTRRPRLRSLSRDTRGRITSATAPEPEPEPEKKEPESVIERVIEKIKPDKAPTRRASSE